MTLEREHWVATETRTRNNNVRNDREKGIEIIQVQFPVFK